MTTTDIVLACHACGGPLVSGLPLCVRCGDEAPAFEDQPLVMLVHGGPPGHVRPREAERLLAHTGDGLTEEEVRRQLSTLPAVFRVAAPDVVVERLAQDLTACGYRTEVCADVPEPLGFFEYAQSLFHKKTRLLPYGVLAGGLALGLGTGSGSLVVLASVLSALWLRTDQRAFIRRLTLRSRILSRRLDVVPEEVVRPVGALLRGGVSDTLRDALGGVVSEHARLLHVLHRLSRPYPELVVRLREALRDLTLHATRLGEKAAAVERAGDFRDPQLGERLQRLRASGGEEFERRLLAMDIAHEERRERLEWLRQVYATLLVRIEAVSDSLRSLRQRALETEVVETTRGAAAVDALLGDLRRELEIAASTVTEVERLDERVAHLLEPA